VTNTSEAKLHYYSDLFSAFYNRFRKIFGIKVDPRKAWGQKIGVRVYRDKAGFDKYQQESGGELGESAVGYYDPNSKELVLYEAEELKTTIDTLFHEGTHLLADLALKDKAQSLPIWFSEGLAEYFGASKFDVATGTIEIGCVSKARLENAVDLLKEGENISLPELLSFSDYSAFDWPHYAFSWALVHMLVERGSIEKKGKKKYTYRKSFIKLYEALARGSKAEAAFPALFGAAADLEKELHSYIKELANKK
jgi:hypothetical protein